MQRDGTDGVDLIVVGAGAGGMTAALAASLRGLRVVLCEATGQVGGTTATSAGTVWVPGNHQGFAAGHGDSAAEAARYLDSLIGSNDPRGLRHAYLTHAAGTLAEIVARTRLRFVTAGLHPDYLQAPGAALAGRALSPVEFDGRELGAEDFRRVRAPMREFMVLGGMMANKADVQALFNRWRTRTGFVRSARLLLRYARDRLRHPRGTRLVLGNALVARLLASLRDAGVEIRFDHRLVQLLHAQGRVSGATFEVAGRRETLEARAGVVLATGGIGHDEGLRGAFAPAGAHPHSLTCPSVRGEGIAAARAVGARLERHPGDFFWQPVSVVPHADGAPGLFPHLYLDRAKPGLIAVDRQGRRFVDEGASYHHFVEGMLAGSGPQRPAYLVCDAEFLRRYGLGVVPPGRASRRHVRSGYLKVAPTLDALAGQLGLDSGTLQATVVRHNDAARSGIDADFHKGSSPLGHFNGDPAHQPNPCLGAIATPPFYALPVWAADAASSSGLATDAFGAVLDVDEHPIPGLYACGNDMASLMRGTYPGPGTTLGPALVFGWRCGSHAATEVARPRADALEAA
jgi:glycine/D-amino acid oxidase-like deaminating enzyme